MLVLDKRRPMTLSFKRTRRKLFRYCYLFTATYMCAYGQQDSPPAGAPSSAGTSNATRPVNSPGKMDKRAFGLLPNYKTIDASLPYQPISSKEKMTIAAKDSFDWTLSIVAAGYAGLGQLTDQNRPLGSGLAGYGNRFVRNYSDQVMGNLLVEGTIPVLVHEDPRYFRRGQGKFWSRVGYATSRVFVTRTDSGGSEFNYSELVGNSLAVGISNSYYPGSRTLGGNFQKFTLQFATDAVSNVLKEFWPDVKRKLPLQHPDN
jgi:hypothetical protein